MATLGLGLGVQSQVSRWDPDALAYIAQVAAADGQSLEPKVMLAINRFVRQCKRDASPVTGVSNWDAMRVTCLMAGPRTLAGALVPLRGPAPTNFSFVSGDYDPAKGLKGNGSTKYLDTNRSNAVDPDLNKHAAVFVYDQWNGVLLGSNGAAFSGVTHVAFRTGTTYDLTFRINGSPNSPIYSDAATAAPSGFAGASRTSAGAIHYSTPDSDGSIAVNYSTPIDPLNILVFRQNHSTPVFSNSRIAYYSIGEAVNLLSLRAAVNQYMEAIA